MKPTLALGALSLAITCGAHAETTLAEYPWTPESTPAGGAIQNESGGRYWRIQTTNATGWRGQVLAVTNGPITSSLYALRGEVRYENVRGDAFLEMWSVFPPARDGGPEARYFSRTLGLSGEMGKISGSSGWRPFSLPFNAAGSSTHPKRLEINLVLPETGQVDLRALRLVQFPTGSFADNSRPSWWSERTTAISGAVTGSVIGILGSIISWLAARKRARRFVVAACQSLIALGAVSAVLWLAAILASQPFFVWFLPGLLAAILLTSMPIRLRQYRRGYAESELRRMTAADSAA